MRRLLEIVFTTVYFSAGAQAFDSTRTLPATGTIEFAFSPDGGAAQMILRAIAAAHAQILVQAYTFTHKDIARALIHAHLRGVDVQVIADAEQTAKTEHQVLTLLKREGIGVWLDAEHGAAHNKLMLIDIASREPILITGSYNFTFAAERLNAENLVLFRGNSELARAFAENWRSHRAHASALTLH